MVGGGSENETRTSVHLHCKKTKNIQEKKYVKKSDKWLKDTCAGVNLIHRTPCSSSQMFL